LIGKEIIENSSNKTEKSYLLFERYYPIVTEALSVKFFLDGDYWSSSLLVLAGEFFRLQDYIGKKRKERRVNNMDLENRLDI